MLQGKSDRKTSNLQHALIKNGPSAALLIQHTWQYIYKKIISTCIHLVVIIFLF